MELKFPKSDGGISEGPNDAGLEHFRGTWEESLAREVIQNSIDAKLDSLSDAVPVKVAFNLEEFSQEELSFMTALKESVNSAIKSWEGENREKLIKIKESFGPVYKCLRISDFNTFGLVGGDEDQAGRWAQLVKTIGGSDGGTGRGGSFGIGKSAPMAASEYRTVLYSTLTHEEKYAFQGFADLHLIVIQRRAYSKPRFHR